MSDVKKAVRLLVEADPWEADEGLRYFDCPECGGHNKLMVGAFDDGGYHYRCLRAACGTSGGVAAPNRLGGLQATKTSQRDPKRLYDAYTSRRDWTPEFGHCPVGVLTDTEQHNVCNGYLTEEQRYVLPIFAPDHSERGYVARAAKDYALMIGQPKALTRMYSDDDPRLSWYGTEGLLSGKHKTIFIVEDQPSACRLSSYGVAAVAIMGTGIGNRELAEILDMQKRTDAVLVVCLDSDAADQTAALARKVPGAVPLFMTSGTKDPKDMERLEIEALTAAWVSYDV